MEAPSGTTARLLITCADQPGIVASVSGFLFSFGANIIDFDQHSSDPEGGKFFMRLEFYMPDLNGRLAGIRDEFQKKVAGPFGMAWSLTPAWIDKKAALLVSRHDHVLLDLLWRWKRGELAMEVTMVVSNHLDLKDEVESFGVRFLHLPFDSGMSAEQKARFEQDLADHLQGNADFVVLARYMQIIPPRLVGLYPDRIINIHHSFLPAFVGSDPYRRAADRGVKLIGATAHYVTERLDQGPIIEQDVIRVSHRNNVQDLKVLGRDIERQVMARAVKWHLDDRIIVDRNKTIVFNK
ncbi:MAG: formyltetrahydrofolate deformylase [Desulfovibrionaceae bacterium]|nr:formyltetrahydrofolate deformylase [Desulfovibrionaceae bacterium]